MARRWGGLQGPASRSWSLLLSLCSGMHPRPGHPTQQKGGARCEDYCRYGSAPVGPPSLLAIDVQADLLFPIRNRDIALGRGDDDGLAGRGRAELLRQVYRDGEDVTGHRHLDILHVRASCRKGCSRLVLAGPSSLRLRGKEQTPALWIDLAPDQLAAVG